MRGGCQRSSLTSADRAESSKSDSHLAHKEATGRAQNLLLPRRRVWIPSDYEASTPPGPEPRLMSLQVDLLKEHARSSSSSQGVAGLKGFHNVGNTCFLNCILQAMTRAMAEEEMELTRVPGVSAQPRGERLLPGRLPQPLPMLEEEGGGRTAGGAGG